MRRAVVSAGRAVRAALRPVRFVASHRMRSVGRCGEPTVRRATLALAAALIALAAARPASAHGMRSVYVEITQTAADRARVAIRSNMPVTGVALTASAPCSVSTTASAGTELGCPGTLTGAALTVTGLGPIASEAVILTTFLDGTTATACITPGAPHWRIPGGGDPGLLATAGRYVRLGVEHIATGADHLLFLLALVLCLRTLRAIMLAETAFTLSHTLSFSASALGWIRVSAAAAEACIAVSLVLVALDIGRGVRDAPHRASEAWKTAGLAFAFGGVHGLGFAGGLAEIGLPATAVPAALAGFAAGVELGQVVFLAVAVSLLALARRTPRRARAIVQLGAYAIGGTGAFWLLQRLAALG